MLQVNWWLCPLELSGALQSRGYAGSQPYGRSPLPHCAAPPSSVSSPEAWAGLSLNTLAGCVRHTLSSLQVAHFIASSQEQLLFHNVVGGRSSRIAMPRISLGAQATSKDT